jgi:colicin import membrane protein
MLKDNPEMQEELQNIAETTIQEAKTDLDIEAQERKQQIAQNAKSGQQQAGNQKGATDQDVKDAVESARAMAEQEVPKIQEDAAEAKAAAANEELKKAKKSLVAAIKEGEQAMKSPVMSPEEKMQAMGEALEKAAQSLNQAAQEAGKRAQAAKDPGQQAAAQKAQAAAEAAAQKVQQMAQNAKSGQQKAGNQKGANEALAKDSVEAYMWAYVARQQARKTPGQRANAVRANIHLKRIKKELSAAEIKKAESEAKAILSKL